MVGDTKQPKVESQKNIKVAKIKSRSDSGILTGRRTRRKFVKEKKVLVSSKAGGENVHISTRRYNATQGNSAAASEKQVGNRKEGVGTMTCSKITNKWNLQIKRPVKSSSIATHPSREKRTRECVPGAEEAAEKGAKTKEGEPNSNTPKRHDSFKSISSALDFTERTSRLKETNETESQGKNESKHEQCKAKDCAVETKEQMKD